MRRMGRMGRRREEVRKEKAGGLCLEMKEVDQVQWLTPVIPALWEAKEGRSRGQEMETIPANMVKPRLY